MHVHPTKIYKKVIAIQALKSTKSQSFWTEWLILIHFGPFPQLVFDIHRFGVGD